LTENLDGVRKPVKEADRKPGPYPYYGASGIVDWVDGYLFDGDYLLVAEDGENLRTRNTPIAFMARGKFWVNNHAHIVRGNGKSDARFLMYALSRTEISGYLTGSTMPKLTQGNLNRILVTCPPLSEQRAIVRVLGTLDDKIELNRRTNETLESMARTLFRAWFVDFDPVRAKADGRSPEGLNAKTAGLFPASFEDSTLGPIPKGWRVAPIGEFVEVARGLSYKGEGLAETGVALHNLNSVYEGGGYKHEGLKHYLGEYRDCHQVRPGDLIVTNTEQGHDHLLIGYSALVPKRYGAFGLFSHHLYRVRPLPGSPLTPPFLHHLLLTSRFRGEVIGYTNGTTVNMLAADGLKRPTFALPPPDLIRRFTDILTPLLDRAEANYDESRTLAASRDALLPKLLSGEVKVGASTLVGKV